MAPAGRRPRKATSKKTKPKCSRGKRAGKKKPAKGPVKTARRGKKRPTRPAPKRKPPFPIKSRLGPQILLHLEELMHERILGKDEAVARIAQALRIRLTRLDFRPERPNGAFLMVGPAGVGKNEFAYALGKILYGDERIVAQLDMRAISSEEDASRLTDTIIAGPQAILLEGLLTAPVRRRPYSVLLLKGVEHAHPVAHRMIQQIIGQGWIEDARGRVLFDRTIIFATSRVPDDETVPTTQIGFNHAQKSYEERVQAKLARKLGVEFVEAFEEVIVLRPLSPEDVRRIARYKVHVVLDRLRDHRRGVEVSDSVYQTFISDEDAARAGAGLLNRTLESKLLNPLARYLLEHPQDHRIRVDVQDGSLVIRAARPGRPVARSLKSPRA